MRKARQTGQGMVEYAGALVIATVLISVVLSIGPDGMGQVFSIIYQAFTELLMGYVSAL